MGFHSVLVLEMITSCDSEKDVSSAEYEQETIA